LQLDRGYDVAIVDADRIASNLHLRRWIDGDWFVPLGSMHRKKLSDFFIDQKTPSHRKHSIPIVASGKEIIWICGMRLDDRFKVTPQTQRTLTFTFR